MIYTTILFINPVLHKISNKLDIKLQQCNIHVQKVYNWIYAIVPWLVNNSLELTFKQDKLSLTFCHIDWTKYWEGTKYPWSGGTGENTPFAKQSKKKGAGKGSQQLAYIDGCRGVDS